MAKLMNPDFNPMDELNQKEFKKEDVQMPTSQVQKDQSNIKTQEEEKLESKIVIPGLTNKDKGNKENQKKLIMHEISSKYTPNYKVNHLSEDGRDKI